MSQFNPKLTLLQQVVRSWCWVSLRPLGELVEHSQILIRRRIGMHGGGGGVVGAEEGGARWTNNWVTLLYHTTRVTHTK